jgi:serine phosphatase RsbU (regulator of sigma subunit)
VVTEFLLSPPQALGLNSLASHELEAIGDIFRVLENLAPFAAFLPWSRLTTRMKPLAVLSMAWGVVMMLYFGVRFTSTHIPGIPDLQAHWSNAVANAEAVTILALVLALLFLLFREQQQTAHERAILAGEMQAAQQVQCMLAPAVLDTLPGTHIAVAFHPVREVGGDFYNCSILPGSRQRILLGDVSGKGAAAAMSAAVLLGAAQQHDDDSPAALLAHLNRVLTNMRLGGFATCLCAELTAAGTITIANAGHLAPYRNGEEAQLESGLPLGIASTAEFTETTVHLQPGDSLTFLSDGVVEAQNVAGELFGFDRARSISTQSAEEIVSAAQTHGQQDDITVLTISLSPVPIAL